MIDGGELLKVTNENGVSSQSIESLKSTMNEHYEECMMYNVVFTKIITIEQQMNIRQINALLKDNNVKSINVKK